MNNTTQLQGFYGLGIAPQLMDAMERAGFKIPTPIQQKSIPVAIEGTDMIGIAQTGTGKTLAFGIPLIQRLAETRGKGLILLPTRELAIQVDETIQKIGRAVGLRTVVLIGGASMHFQIQSLRKEPHVIIATPGRLIDHMEQKTVRLDRIKVLVLDEADRMLDMGFAPQLKKIFVTLPKERQTMLFSATMPKEILSIAATHMHLPVQIEIARAGTMAEKITQEVFVVRKEDKIRLLRHVLEQHRGSILVFSRTKHGAKKITRDVRAMGHTAAEIHANRSLAQRREALEGFKSGRFRVLVATDIAARGIDVKGIEIVVNFDLPDNPDDYVHRIGRTGRAGQSGHAISFATPDQSRDVRDIERLIRKMLPVSKLPELPPAPPRVAADEYESRPSRFPRGQSARPYDARRPQGSRGPSRGFRGRRFGR